MFGEISLSTILLALLMTYAVVLTYKVLNEKNLVKAILYTTGQAIAYTLALALLAAPDLVLVYMAIGIGMHTLLFLYIVSHTEDREYETIEKVPGKGDR